jgi:hypothetical protein
MATEEKYKVISEDKFWQYLGTDPFEAVYKLNELPNYVLALFNTKGAGSVVGNGICGKTPPPFGKQTGTIPQKKFIVVRKN